MEYNDTVISISEQIEVSNYLTLETREDIINGIILGLSAEQKHISSRFFYDDAGSALFEDITHLPEYYPTRTETAILENIAPLLVKNARHLDIIELGSGDCSKISILLDAIPYENRDTIRYIPVDVSSSAIYKSSVMLSVKYPQITIHGILADFLKHFNVIPRESRRIICFFGSTIGNLTRNQAIRFLMDVKNSMQPGDQLLLGLDMVKNNQILENAYNDAQGITAAFNKNILHVVNHTLKTDFDPELFEHMSFYNDSKNRIEMHLIALQDMEVYSVLLTSPIKIKKGETIHTENSHKYTREYIDMISEFTGLTIKEIYTDPNQWFSLVHFID